MLVDSVKLQAKYVSAVSCSLIFVHWQGKDDDDSDDDDDPDDEDDDDGDDDN